MDLSVTGQSDSKAVFADLRTLRFDDAPFFFLGRILFERFMGFLDQDPASVTCGCFDRAYWHYRLHDVANARFQEAALYLVRLTQAVPDLREVLTPYVRDAAGFWSRMRHGDGSVDEVYPWERSFCATAMSTQAITTAMLVLEDDFGIDLRRTGRWLARNRRPDVANQLAAACSALYNISVLTGIGDFAAEAERTIDLIADKQLPDGCYLEYDGADIGYATVTLALLGLYASQSGSEAARQSMRRCERFLGKRVRENGAYPYEDTSRRTQFLYPSGLRRLGSPVFRRIENGLKENGIINPLWMDDRYSIPLAVDYLLAHLLNTGVEKC